LAWLGLAGPMLDVSTISYYTLYVLHDAALMLKVKWIKLHDDVVQLGRDVFRLPFACLRCSLSLDYEGGAALDSATSFLSSLPWWAFSLPFLVALLPPL
jgi:hypothetical protein